jgi:hypothetical protein
MGIMRPHMARSRSVSMQPATRLRLSRSHRIVGLVATVPIIGWIVSSFVLHGVALTLPNGLQGVYELEPMHAEPVVLEDDALIAPDDVLAALSADGLGRIYWLRLDVLGGRPAYVVKPGPFDLERVYDARTGARLDPLPDEMLRAIANEQLTGTEVAEMHPGDEFNRYYTVDRVPAVAVTMEGTQPSELVFNRASGRILRRTDPMAEWFHKAYRSVHVWQWGDSLRLFTALLYGLVGTALLLVALGYTLWWTRRDTRRRWTDAVRPARRVHARFAPVAGFLLATQMLVGAYLWFNLGLIEPRFRGQGSFAEDWSGGIATSETLALPSTIARALAASGDPRGHETGHGGADKVVGTEASAPAASRVEEGTVTHGMHPVQRYEWRAVGDQRFWLAYAARNENGTLIDARSGEILERLSPELAARAGAEVVEGIAAGPPVEATEYWMDFNARVPTYRFRFTDPDDTDVHVSQVTGEVVQRRPAIWRAFGPFLSYHTFGFTGNPWLDTILLTALQLTILVMVITGWRLALRRRSEP